MSFRKRLFKYLKRGVRGLAFLFVLNSTSIGLTYFFNRNISSEKRTAVFTCDRGRYDFGVPPPISSKIIDFFMYTPVTLKQNMEGYPVDWFSNADKKTLIDKLYDPNYENLVLIGHGSRSSYSLSDGDVKSYNLKCLPLPKRRGEFLQYTCGDKEAGVETLKDVLFDEKSYYKGFNSIIDPVTNYSSAWADLIAKNE